MIPRQLRGVALAGIGLLLLVGLSLGLLWPSRSRHAQVVSQTPSESRAAERTPLFTDITSAAGLEFVHTAGPLESYFFPSIMAGGCALLDFDRDGLLDVYLINGNDSLWTSPAGAGSAAITNRLYRQTAGGRFSDVTESSGLGDTGFGMGVAVGDVNNDGFPDVYVTNAGADRLYLNQRDGTFIDGTDAAGIENILWAASASFLDYDRDGWLDLYVTNYVDYYAERACPDSNGRPDFCGPQMFFGTSDKLYRNITGEQARPAAAGGFPTMADVRFQDVSRSSGIAAQSGPGLGVVCADFDGDGWCDIYVANDRTANFLWINRRDGTFVDEAVPRGAAFDPQGRPQASMGIALGDVNGDSAPDLYVTHLEGESNALYVSDGRGMFNERSAASGLLVPTFPYTGFGTAFVDIDHDAVLDIVVVNGRVKRGASPQPPAAAWAEYAERNQVFLGDGHGRFRDSSNAQESFCAPAAVSRGLAVGDIDRDGDVDLLVTSIAAPARLLRNDAAKSGGWLTLRAIDPERGGRDMYGAVVTVFAGDRRWSKTIQPGFSYLSSSEPAAHFGMSTARRYDRISVVWPEGASETFTGGPVNEVRILERGAGEPTDARSRP